MKIIIITLLFLFCYPRFFNCCYSSNKSSSNSSFFLSDVRTCEFCVMTIGCGVVNKSLLPLLFTNCFILDTAGLRLSDLKSQLDMKLKNNITVNVTSSQEVQ